MFKEFIIGKYYPIKSALHKLSPVNKIICTFIFLITLFIIDKFYLYMLLASHVMILMIISNIPIKNFINGIKNLRLLIIFVFIFDYLFTNNILLASTSSLRIILIIVYTLLFTYTTKPDEITYGLEKVFSPLKYIKVPVKEVALSLTLALQFIPIIFEQADKILKSQASRGIDFKYSNIKGKMLALSTILVPMFILSFKRADNLADSMEVRLYNSSIKRSYYKLNNWSELDNTIFLLHIAILVFLILSEVIVL